MTTQQSDGATAQVQEKAQEAAGQAKEQAQQVAGQAKDQARTQVDQRSTQAGQQIKTQASDIRTVSEQLREQGKEGPAKIAEQAADRAEKLGSYLEDSDADRILHDVEDFARQKPWAVIAGGIALGFAASRFLKASQTERYGTLDQRRAGGTGTAGLTTGTIGTGATGIPTPAAPATPATPALGGTGNELSGGVTPGSGTPGTSNAERGRTGAPVVPTPGVTAAGSGGV